MASKVDRELEKIEERRAEAEAQAGPRKTGIRATVKRIARDLALRRVSTRR